MLRRQDLRGISVRRLGGQSRRRCPWGLASELESQLPKQVRVRSQIAEFSELTPAEILEELVDRGVLEP